MASSTGISPRCNQSPLLRRKRDAAVSNQQCVQVQWRFLQHQNPAPPKFSTRNSKPTSSQNKTPAQLSQAYSDHGDRDARTRSQRGSPSKLFDLFANPQVEAEISEEHKRQHEGQLRQQQKREQQQCRVLNDILGETQRKAMLNRIMAEMEALALQTDHEKPKSQHKRRGEPSAIKENTVHERDENKLAPLFRKHLGGVQALRNNLAPLTTLTPSDRNSINLLPQRRISALGAIYLEELVGEEGHQGSEDDEDDDDDDDDQGDDQDEDAKAGMRKRTAESIAISEIRKLRKRHQRRQQQLEAQGQSFEHPVGSTTGNHIFWQKSSRVKVALDIPQSLQIPVQLVNASGSPVHQPTPRASSIVSMSPAVPPPPDVGATSPATFTDEQPSFNNLVTRKRRPFLTRTDSTQSIMCGSSKSSKTFTRGRNSTSSTSPCATNEPGASIPAVQSPPKSPLSPVVSSPRDARKLHAPYGAWYLPRRQWWDQHQKERQALAERFPEEAEALALAQEGQHDHCHHGAQDRNHMPPVVTQAATASAHTITASVVASRISVSSARATSDAL